MRVCTPSIRVRVFEVLTDGVREIPSSQATSAFVMPSATHSTISRSRGVSVDCPFADIDGRTDVWRHCGAGVADETPCRLPTDPVRNAAQLARTLRIR